MSQDPSKPVLSKQEVNALSQEGFGGVDPRFLKTSGIEAFTGNELLVKGALEAGVSLITGYPGSPVSDVFEVVATVAPYLAKRGIVAQIANNEGLATSRLNGARQAGLRAMAVMKSVGFHVGADALAVGNLMETRQRQGGAVAVVGDDPWNETTQINSDSRYLSKHLHMPILEPSTFQELKDWVNVAFDLSGISDLYITYLITTNLADGGGSVRLSPHPDIAINRLNKTTLSTKAMPITHHVLIPPHTSMREATLPERFTRLIERSRELHLNAWHGPKKRKMPVGFIASGLSFSYLMEVFQLLGLWDNVPVLKIGMTYPLDKEVIRDMTSRVNHLVVIEEKRGFLEEQIAEMMIALKQEGKLYRPPALWGKKFPDGDGFPSNRGLNASIILETLGPSFLRWNRFFPTLFTEAVKREIDEIKNTSSSSFNVPLRTPTFCPGCPHRDSSTAHMAVKKRLMDPAYMAKKNSAPMDVIYHGESGCHSMLQFAPNEGLMQNYSGMGMGGGTGAGMAPFVTNKQVVFLGDGTFFHSGVGAVSDSLKNQQDITYVILENKTTAMTGHQPGPGNDIDIMGQSTPSQDVEKTLRGMSSAGLLVIRINPEERDRYEKILEKTILKPGVKIIIADKECAITLNRRLNAEKKRTIEKNGFLAREEKINVTPDVCEYCLVCTTETGCPGLTVEETPYGRKIVTDLSTCVDDGACARTKACPSFEKVIIKRTQPLPKSTLQNLDMSKIPEPQACNFDVKWASYTAGVGGMGAGIVNAVLVRAGIREGYQVSFLDKKGLAIRNGGVYGHVVYSKRGPVQSPVIPYGKADLLIGLDIMEAARALDARTNLRVAHPARTHAVVNNHKNETIFSLMGRQDFNPAELANVIKNKCCSDGFFTADFSQLSEKHIGSKLYVNMMLMGVAYQRGWIPLKGDSILTAISGTVRKADIQSNHQAFNLGRFLAAKPVMLRPKTHRKKLKDLVREKAGNIAKDSWVFGFRRSREYMKLIEHIYRWMDLPRESHLLLAQTIYDLCRRNGISMARKYSSLIWDTYRKDRPDYGYRATQEIILNLFWCIAIKDEVWVAKLLTSPEKYARDRDRYQIDPARGDSIHYVHFTRPRFVVFGRAFEFDVKSRDWMLKVMSQLGFLRALLPGWHQEEREFRDWYIKLVRGFSYFESGDDYDAYVNALAVPENVRGYREVRTPTIAKAKKDAARFLEDIAIRNAARPSPFSGDLAPAGATTKAETNKS